MPSYMSDKIKFIFLGVLHTIHYEKQNELMVIFILIVFKVLKMASDFT